MNFVPFIIPVFSYILQSYPRFFNKYFGVDVWTRMIEANLIQKNNHRIPMQKISGGFILEGYFNYPPVFPWLLSFIPKRKLLEIQGFIAPLFDFIQIILVYFMTLQLTGDSNVAILSQIIYATTPIIVLENSYLTPRSLGYLNFTLAFYPLLLYSITPSPVYLFFAAFFTLLIFFTHKFATQSLLFITIFFTIIERNPLYLLTFLLSMLLAIIISRGYYFRVLGGHIGNILFWMKNYKFRFAHQVRGLVKKSKERDFVGKIYYLLGTFTPLTLIGTNLWIALPLLLIFGKLTNTINLPYENIMLLKMATWVGFCYIFSVLVLSLKPLIPIGEGQRYLEMAVAPTSVLGAILLSSLFNSPFKNLVVISFPSILAVNLFLIIFIQIKGIIRDKNRTMTKDMNKIFQFINRYKPTPRILCIPHQITTMILYNTKAKVLVDIESGTLQKIPDVFPTIKKNVYQIAKKYNLNLLILKKDYATIKELGIKSKDLLFESEDTQIIAI